MLINLVKLETKPNVDTSIVSSTVFPPPATDVAALSMW